MPNTSKTRAHCNECGGNKNHDVLHLEKNSWTDTEHVVWGSVSHQLLKCAGCDSIKLMRSETYSEDFDENGEVERISYYPPAISRPKPSWFYELQMELTEKKSRLPGLLEELYIALHNDQRMLAAMGVRAALEYVMIEAVGDCGSFEKNLQAFEGKGLVSTVQKARLETILDAGHATIHRMYRPSKSDLVTLVDITEHVIQSVYLHEKPVSDLKRRIPARPAKKSKKLSA